MVSSNVWKKKQKKKTKIVFHSPQKQHKITNLTRKVAVPIEKQLGFGNVQKWNGKK